MPILSSFNKDGGVMALLDDYIYSGHAKYDCEIYVDGIKEELDIFNFTVNGSDGSISTYFGNLFTQYINITIDGRVLNPGQQLFIRLKPEGFGEYINVGAFYIQGDPAVSGTCYTYTAYDKTIFFDIPMDFVKVSQPIDPEDDCDISSYIDIFQTLYYIAQYLGCWLSVPSENTAWSNVANEEPVSEEEKYKTVRFLEIYRRIRMNRVSGMNVQYDEVFTINDLSKITVSSLLKTIGIVTQTDFRVVASLVDGKIEETIKAVPIFSDNIVKSGGGVDYSEVIYNQDGGTQRATIEVIESAIVKLKRYEFVESEDGQLFNYSESDYEQKITGYHDSINYMELQLPFCYRGIDEAGYKVAPNLIRAIRGALSKPASIPNPVVRHSYEIIGDPRIRNGMYMNLYGLNGTSSPDLCYIATYSYTWDGGIKANISSGNSENNSITMGGTTLASIAQAVKLLQFDTKNLSSNSLSLDEFYSKTASFGFLKADELEARVGTFGYIKTDELEAKVGTFDYIKTNELQAEIGKYGYITANEIDSKLATFGYVKTDELEAKVGSFGYIKTDGLQAEIGKYGYLTANEIDSKLASFGYVKTDELEAVIGTFGYLTAQQADIKYANIGLSNVTTENVGLLLNKVGMIDRATIVDGHITGFLDSVEINANRITAGTLIADRLLLRGSQQGLLYQLNNSGELTSINVDTLDGTILTRRTVTADKLVAKSITANELDVTNIFANTEVVNTLVGNEAFINKIMSNQIIVGVSQDAANALTKATNALSTAGTASSTASSALAAANTASTNANSATTIAELARMMMGGRLLYTDPTFLSGMNSVSVYNNSGNGAVSVARDTKSNQGMTSCPTTSGYIVRILVTGTATPGLGGFYQNLISRANAKFVVKYLINLPKGYKLCTATNSMGSGYTDKFIGDVSGTGTWKEYYRIVQCGASGTFSGGGHVYVVADGGAAPTASSPLVWYLGAIYAYDVTDVNPIENWRYQNTTYINGGHIYTGTIEAAAIKVGTITGDRMAAGTITADKINLTDLFSKNITASNLHITGGSVNISTSSTETSLIELRCNSTYTSLRPYGLYAKNTAGGTEDVAYFMSHQLRITSKYNGVTSMLHESPTIIRMSETDNKGNETVGVQITKSGILVANNTAGGINAQNNYLVTGNNVYQYLMSNYLPQSYGIVKGTMYWENTDWEYIPGTGISNLRDARDWGQSFLYVGTKNGAFSVAWAASDEALKKNIKKSREEALNKIRGINFIEYDWRDEKLGHVDLGISANQLEKIIPSAVFHVKQPEGSEHEYLRNLNSQELTAYSLKAIQELYDIVMEQREIIEQLRNERQG